MAKHPQSPANIRKRALSDFKQQLALQKFQEERPQLWLQAQRIGKLVDIQNRLDQETFAAGSCFIHASTVSFSSFCVKKVLGIDLDTCQVSVEIYGDDHLEAGVVILPIETIEWFGFPTQAVSTGIHFEGFTSGAFQSAAPSPASQELIERSQANDRRRVKTVRTLKPRLPSPRPDPGPSSP